MNVQRLLVTAVCSILTGAAHAAEPGPLVYPPKPVPVDQAAAKIALPEGFRATLFAGEPDVVQPIAFTFDDRGRLWVAECLSYPKWTKDGTGRDRISIYEDRDGDGRHDVRTVFAENLANLSGLEIGFGGVWICSLPNLLFIPDRDGDDRPDGPPQTVLDGWDPNCRHNVFNGLAWGPDGWLYGLNGILSRSAVGRPGTPDERRVKFDCGVWRVHPVRHTFEVVAWGTTNPWGIDWDDYGEMFITNCVIKHIFHVVPGGHYERMFGQDPNPHVYGLMESCADHIHWAGGHWTDSRGGQGAHSDAGGGHAHSGCCVYLGDNFPAEYRNNVFMCNIHGNRLNRDRLERRGSSYVAKHEKDFLFANDPWFRGLNVKYGPDGGLYVSDWCDTGECHNYDVADVTNGRIVKVTYGMPKSSRPLDLQTLGDAELVDLQRHENDWRVRHARRVLQERAAAGKLRPDTAERLRKQLAEQQETTRRLRALWTLHAIGGLDEADFAALLTDRDEHVRAWSVTLACEPGGSTSKALLALLLEAANHRREPSPLVRRHLASAIQRLAPDDAVRVFSVLSDFEDVSDDPVLSMLFWYAIEPFVSGHAKPESLLSSCRTALVRRYVVRRAVEDAAGDPDALRTAIGRFLSVRSESAVVTLDACNGVLEALKGARSAPAPDDWETRFPTLSRSDSADVRAAAIELGVLFGDEKLLSDLTATVQNAAADVEKRRDALELLVPKRRADLLPVLLKLLDDGVLRGDALRALASYDDPRIPAAIVDRFSALTDLEKADALQTLAVRASYGLALLDAIEAGRIDRRDVPSAVAVQLAGLKHPQLVDRLTKVWGAVRPTSQEKKDQAERLKRQLAADVLKQADVSHGRTLFVKTCAACHKLFDEGGKIGPELTGSQRFNLDYLLENVLDPSAKVGSLYQVTVFELDDGRVVQGIVAEENDRAVTVQTPNQRIALAKDEIESRQQTRQSMMPEGLFDRLGATEIRDLMGYLISPGPIQANEDRRFR